MVFGVEVGAVEAGNAQEDSPEGPEELQEVNKKGSQIINCLYMCLITFSTILELESVQEGT